MISNDLICALYWQPLCGLFRVALNKRIFPWSGQYLKQTCALLFLIYLIIGQAIIFLQVKFLN
jgi:hypothetical protein